MNCPRCGSVNRCKDGIVKGRQRYKCKDCKYH
ncbi:MAG: IS1 family transposase, partial [Bacteroidales bacterium]|nr:IS1 family transposase [Bacteroidales bacterium]